VSRQKVTLRQLATHISGLPNIVNNDTGELVTGVQIASVGEGDVDAAWSKVQTLPIEFPAGEKYSYNQTNYILLGEVIDKLSGEPFTQFIKQQQLDSVGMPSTVYADDSAVVPHRARSYSNIRYSKDGQMEHTPNLTEQYVRFPPQFLTAAGLTTNAEDLAHWIIALEQYRLLKKESSLATLWTPSILNDGKNGSWGLGWPIFARPQHTSYVPFGGAKAAFAVYPEDDVAVVILTNLQGSMPERFVDRVAGYYQTENTHFLSIWMFSLVPLWETEIMMPMPIRIATPINVQTVPILCRIPIFQRAAMTPPTKTMKPTRYKPAHFIDPLPM
jgi:CubicO group peptidase (beta-lactamase class C family)